MPSWESPSTRRMNLLIMKARILPAQRKHLPAAPARPRGELLVGIDRHRARHVLEQRQIVVRIAVARARGEIREAPAKAMQPLVDAAQLPLAKARRACNATGEAAFAALGLGGDQVRDAELARDRTGDEAVGRGDDGAKLACGEVARDELARRRRDHRHDAGAHELRMPAREVLPGMLGKWAQSKGA